MSHEHTHTAVLDTPTTPRVVRFARWMRRWIVKPISLPSLVLSIALLLPASTLLTTVWLFGWQLQVVRTSSMSPTYPSGTLLVSEPTAPADVRTGDVLTFSAPWRNRALVTHRVRLVEIAEDGARQFITRGDASDAVYGEAGDDAIGQDEAPRSPLELEREARAGGGGGGHRGPISRRRCRGWPPAPRRGSRRDR